MSRQEADTGSAASEYLTVCRFGPRCANFRVMRWSMGRREPKWSATVHRLRGAAPICPTSAVLASRETPASLPADLR